MLIKARDAVLYWDSGQQECLVISFYGPQPTLGAWGHCERVVPTNPRASSHMANANDCFLLALRLIVQDGLSPQAVHREMSKVYEYHWYAEKVIP